jgi:hypothetical protein
VQTEQPLTSVAAFALALVEASSSLTATNDASRFAVDPATGTETLPVAGDDTALAAAE